MAQPELSRREFVMAGAGLLATPAAASGSTDTSKIRSFHPDMEYRPLGRTGMMVSAVSMGGHWKRVPFKPGTPDFKKNRRDVVYACLEAGINYIDACIRGEVEVYAEALGSRREEMNFGFDWTMARSPEIAGSLEALKKGLDDGLKGCGLRYVDLWRLTMREQATKNSQREIENIVAALDWAKKTGRARFTGISTHHRPWVAEALGRYPQIEVVVTPYSAGSKEAPTGSMFTAVRKHRTGLIGIKPFASGNVFASRGTPDSPTKDRDDERARLSLRHVLAADALSAAIPGLITVDQVRNAAAAVKERRRLDVAENSRRERMAAAMWQNLPPDYAWLRNWEFV